MSNKLFECLPQIKHRIVDFMMTVNENINWLDFFNQYGTLPDNKILKRIRSLVWVDKSIDYDNGMSDTSRYFKHYVSLIAKFAPMLEKYPLYIIAPKPTADNGLIDEFTRDIEIKYSIVCRLLTLMRTKYAIVSADDVAKGNVKVGDMNILLPLGSLTYTTDELNVFKSFAGVVIPEGYDNICFNEEDRLVNNVILNVKALMMSADDVSEIVNTEYTMFNVNKP